MTESQKNTENLYTGVEYSDGSIGVGGPHGQDGLKDISLIEGLPTTQVEAPNKGVAALKIVSAILIREKSIK